MIMMIYKAIKKFFFPSQKVNQQIENQEDYINFCIQDGKQHGYSLISQILNPQQIQWIVKSKNDNQQKRMLKQLAKDYQLIIWLHEIFNGDEQYKIVTILGFSDKQSNLINIPFRKLLKIFEQPKDTPMLIKLGKLFAFNKYGMHQRQDEDDCELCSTYNKSKYQILNCCGKSVCDQCKKYYPKNICPFCKQKQINLRLIVMPIGWKQL